VADAIETEAARDDHALNIFVKEGINDPPVVVATDDRTNLSRVIWDPNPQLRRIKLGEASVYKWKDKTGRDWVGGLYKPPDYVPGTVYPLVIQAGSFSENAFFPSGSWPTSFAAQELAAVGFVVLQVENCSLRSTTEEAPCQVSGYESAVEQLTRDRVVDPSRLGIVGFSRNCYYVLQTLTTSGLKFQAASITDGVTYSYFNYVTTLGLDGEDSAAHGAEAVIGAAPIGTGLNRWLMRSPGFNLDKVAAPLVVAVANRPLDVVGMWDIYAVLHYLHKPVDFIVRNSDEHVFTNPGQRLLSQGNTVEWFQFWMQGYEDPDPSKVEQYSRWRELRKLQRER
jgi:dipeptidyl aminopeptidase/acylaminoacyl peptidase